MVGAAAEDYLKAIYKLARCEERVMPSALAEQLGVSPAAVTKMLRRLQQLKLVVYEPSARLELTPAGEKMALEVIRHHRLLEAYLAEALGYSWDQVDAEAERLEHVISEEFEDRIAEMLGHPTHDPHGDPIPTKEGHLVAEEHAPLSELQPGQRANVRRVTDGDPHMLRYLGDQGLYPDTEVEMLAAEPFGGPLRVRVAGIERALGRELAANVFVAVADEAA